MKTVYSPPKSGAKISRTAVFAVCTTVGLFFVVPLANFLNFSPEDDMNFREIDSSMPPPPPPPTEPPPPPEQEQEEEDPELNEPPPPLNLSQIEMTLNAGMGGAVGAGFASFDANFNALDEIKIFELKDLDRIPVPISQVEPVHPYDLKRNRVTGTATVEFIVDETGSVRDPRAISFTHREFGDSAVDAVRNWKFQPGEKDGKKVRTRVRQMINFSL